MATKNNDKIVAYVYETTDYEKFKTLAENRGHKETGGIKDKKIATLQRLIDNDRWVHNMSRVKVNESFEVVDGAHTLEICKRNGLPVRYEVTDDPNFNELSKRDLIGSIYNINSITTSWSPSELFNAAVQTKAPLALILNEIIEENDNNFLWTDLMGLLEKDSNYFMGRWRKADMHTFERKELIEFARSNEFALELKHFVKFNQKARIAPRKGLVLRAAYDILWYCRDMVNPSLFRKSLASLPDTVVTSGKMNSDDHCRRALIQHYNKSQGQQVETATVIFALKHKNAEEIVEL